MPLPGFAVQLIRKLVPATIVSTSQGRALVVGAPWPVMVIESVATRFASVIPVVFAFVHVPSSIALIAVPVPTVSVLPFGIDVLPPNVTAPVLVENTPVAAEKSKAPVPAVAVMPLFAASVTAPFSETAPVLVLNTP